MICMQTVTFPCGRRMTVTFDDLQQYAGHFTWLPKFKELASGVSSATWYCFLTVQPVLSLGLVGALGPSPEQLQAMCEYLDQHQPQTSSHIVPALPAVTTHAPNILRAVPAASTQVHNQQLALPAVSAVSV